MSQQLSREIKEELERSREYKEMYFKHNQDEEYLKKYSKKCLQLINADRRNWVYGDDYQTAQIFLAKLLKKQKRYAEALEVYQHLWDWGYSGDGKIPPADTLKQIAICKRKLEKQRLSLANNSNSTNPFPKG